MSDSLVKEMEFAVEAAWQAGRSTLGYFLTAVQPEWKEDATPVTVADREAEETIRKLLVKAYPADGIVGEEFGNVRGTSGRRWLVDPIDGTKSFIQGVPLYGVLIGLEVGGEMVAGAAYMPALDEMVCAARGEGCWWNGRRASVSSVASLADACVCYTSSRSFSEHGKADTWEAVRAGARISRGWGDCYGYLLVATGRADIMLDPVVNPWDCGPLPPILEEAGGTFTDWQGRRTVFGPDGFATNGSLYDELLPFLRD